MGIEEADEFIKKLELMPIPELESSEEESEGWEVIKSRRNVRKEKVCAGKDHQGGNFCRGRPGN